MEGNRSKTSNITEGSRYVAAGKNNFFDDSHDDDFSSYFKKNKTSNNPFEDDDEDFNSASKKKSFSTGRPYVAGSAANAGTTSTSSPTLPIYSEKSEEPVLSARDLYLQEVQAIQDRTLDTTFRSLRLIDESETVGVAAAEELLSQREQLENANSNLDNMNATLDKSQKHINSIKSVFGGIKSWWNSKPVTTESPVLPTSSSSNLRDIVEKSPNSALTPRQSFGPDQSSPYRSSGAQPLTGSSTKDKYDAGLDSNLDSMSLGLSRLKGLAEGLGGEIQVQNKLLDSMNSKTERVDLKIGEQQKHMDKILGKKK